MKIPANLVTFEQRTKFRIDHVIKKYKKYGNQNVATVDLDTFEIHNGSAHWGDWISNPSECSEQPMLKKHIDIYTKSGKKLNRKSRNVNKSNLLMKTCDSKDSCYFSNFEHSNLSSPSHVYGVDIDKNASFKKILTRYPKQKSHYSVYPKNPNKRNVFTGSLFKVKTSILASTPLKQLHSSSTRDVELSKTSDSSSDYNSSLEDILLSGSKLFEAKKKLKSKGTNFTYQKDHCEQGNDPLLLKVFVSHNKSFLL